jgi:hypothetical protein
MITYYSSLYQMVFIHLLVGMGITTFAVLHSNKKNKNRKLFTFGTGLLGQQNRWFMWYSWALTFELVTSFLGYEHTQMLYYELGMSLFQAAALVGGAFIVDRFADFFTGNIEELSIPKPDLSAVTNSIKSAKEVIGTKIGEAVEKAKKDHEVERKALEEEIVKHKNDFDKLINGH